MNTYTRDLPAPFDSDDARRVVGPIAVPSARLELYLAAMRGQVDEDETRSAVTPVMLHTEDNAAAIRRAVDARQLGSCDEAWDAAMGAENGGVPFQPAITDWTRIAAGLLKERGDLMRAPWFNTKVDGTVLPLSGHSRTGDAQSVTVPALEHVSRRIDEACDRFSALFVYVFLHNRPRPR